MKKVYLDNNILVDIEDGKVDLFVFLSIKDVMYFFSPAHIEELIEGENVKALSIAGRLNLIEHIAMSNCILPGMPFPELCEMTPQQMYVLTKRTDWIRDEINFAVSNTDVDRERFLDILKICKIEVNNYSPQDVLTILSEHLYEAEQITEQINLLDYLQMSEAYGHSSFNTLFNFLDYACYYKDKKTDHSNIARMHDSSHAYYAQLCDILVSQDKRMRYKTKAVYSYFHINTKVLTLEEFLSEVK